jgi:DNA-binding response OmpR family regulator
MNDCSKICPNCGTDIELDRPITINDFSMLGAGRPLFYQRKQVNLTHSEALICWSLMKAYPGFLTTDALGERLGSEVDDVNQLIRVLVCRMRRKLRAIGAPNAIATMRGHHSYQWDPRAQS